MLPDNYGDAPSVPQMYMAIVDLQRQNAELFEQLGVLLAQTAPVLPDAPLPYEEPEEVANGGE